MCKKVLIAGGSGGIAQAMSQGLIPIVSDYHFNRSIVGDNGLVVEGFDTKDYADCMKNILESEDLQELSDQMINRVRSCYSYSVVIPRIVNELKSC